MYPRSENRQGRAALRRTSPRACIGPVCSARPLCAPTPARHPSGSWRPGRGHVRCHRCARLPGQDFCARSPTAAELAIIRTQPPGRLAAAVPWFAAPNSLLLLTARH